MSQRSDSLNCWDRWADVREQLEKAFRDPDHVFDPDEKKILHDILRFSEVAQAELHLARPKLAELEEARELAVGNGDEGLRKAARLLGWRRGGRGRGAGTDWMRVAREYGLLVEGEDLWIRRPLTPHDALVELAGREKTTADAICKHLQEARPLFHKALDDLRQPGPPGAHPWSLPQLQRIVAALDEMPQRHEL